MVLVGVLPRLWTGRHARPRSAAAALGDARDSAVVSPAAVQLDGIGRARHPDRGGMVGRRAAPCEARPHVRLLCQRAGAAFAAARRSARGFIWFLYRIVK